MKINAATIKQYNPCRSGFENFLKHHFDFFGTMSEFLALDNIPYSDKIWLAEKIVNIKTLQQWSVECAEHVVDNFNKIYPEDTRVSDCIENTKLFLEGKTTLEELELAAKSAGLAAKSAWLVTKSAAWSAKSAWSAAGSVTWAAKSAWSARSAAKSAESASKSAANEKDQENIILSILIALLANEENK